ncbi:MAG: hypothetical protein OXD43_01560 [Bacteroidetes bacterium]|nr:hypothetical protein [Bacteroidota bacterium]
MEPPLVPFEELFVLEDTVRLDYSVIVGKISFMDVDPEGNFLITDGIGNSVFLFSPTGEHRRIYNPLACLSGRDVFRPWNSLFLDGGKVMTLNLSYGVVVFSPDGSCSVQCKAHPTLV